MFMGMMAFIVVACVFFLLGIPLIIAVGIMCSMALIKATLAGFKGED